MPSYITCLFKRHSDPVRLGSAAARQVGMGRAIFFVMLTVAVGFLFAMVATTAVRAQVFQFGRDNPNYAAALSIAAAQEAGSDVDIEQKIILDEDFVPADFGINGVGILPTSPFYFLKGARRGVQDVFTFGAEAKTERRLQFAAEKLLEAKELAGREGVDEEAVRNALDNYRDELETVGERVDRAAGQIGDEASEDLAKKFMDSVVKYEKSLGKFEKDLSPESFEHIQDVKDRTSETFGKVFDLVEPDVVSEKLVEVLNEQKGSEFKDFKNIEVLKEVAEKVPEDVRGSIELAAENTLTKLQFELEQFAQAKKALFEDFIEQIGGNEVRHLEIINELEVRPLSDELREAILGAKEETLSRTQDRLEGFADRPEERDRFLEHLGDGNIEDIRILDELENSVSSGVLAGLVDVRREAEESLVDRFERAADDSGERDELFRSIERFHDAKSLSVLDEIGDLIPDDKQDIFSSLKERAAEEIKNDIDRARDDSQRAIIFNALAGDHPEHFDVLDRFEDEVDVIFDIGSIFDRIVEAQFDRVRERIEQIHDEERFERFESEFREREDFFRTASTDFEFFDFFDERRDIFESPERALTKIDEAQNTINELAAIADSLPFDVGFDDGRFDSEIQEVERLLELADRKLEIARVSTEYNDVGRAFGEAQAADSIAQEGIAIARAYKSGRRESDTSNVPDFLPKDLFERRDPEKRTTIVRERDEVFEDRFEVYNNFEFSEFCFFVQGFLKAPLLCVLPDGRQFDVRGQSFPIEIPYEFVPRFGPPDQGGDPNFCPIVYAPSFDFCPDGYIVEDFDERGCLLPARCERKEDYDRRVHPDGLCGGLSGYQCAPGFYCEYPPYDFDDPNAGATDYLGTCVADNYTCDAFFEGYIYDDFSRTCRPDSASGCYDPFIYHSRLECEVANDLVEKPDPGTQCESYASEGGCERNGCKWTIDFGPADAPYWTCRPPTAGGVCPNFPSVGSCPAGEQRVLSFSSPECGEYYKCITDISDEGYPYTFSTGFRVNTRYEAGNYCYAASGTTQQRILEECKDFGVYLDNTVPTNADCPSGSHPQADGGGIYYCLNDVDDYNGLCYELHSGNKIQCPSQGFGGGNCPFGYHYHSKDGGVCMNNFEDSAKGCLDGRGTTPVACPSLPDHNFDPRPCWSGATYDASINDCVVNNDGPTPVVPIEREANCPPWFAFSKWDDTGTKYCQLNDQRACAYYPNEGEPINYSSENCPTEDGGTGGSCGSYFGPGTCNTAYGCEWYYPPTAGEAGYCRPTSSSSVCDYDNICDANENQSTCPGDCGSSSNWVTHVWYFSDGSTVSSQILDRTDKEYFDYVALVHAECSLISQSQFFWRSGAGDDSAANWQNFGIPDCSGSTPPPPVGGLCTDNITEATCTVQPECQWNSLFYSSEFGTGTCEPKTYGSACGTYSTSQSACEANYDCHWEPASSSGSATCVYSGTTTGGCDYDNFCDYNETTASCPADCGSDGTPTSADCQVNVTSATCTTTSGCKWFTPDASASLCEREGYYAGDASSCPEFAYSVWDSNGARYCRLNNEVSCDYTFPSYLTNDGSYSSANCPDDAPSSTYEVCGDGIDNDGDGFIDDADPECTGGGSGCGSYYDSATCTASAGCEWYTSTYGGGAWCQSSSYAGTDCSVYSDVTSCDGSAGCNWNYPSDGGAGWCTSTNYSGSCPSGYHYHEDSGGYCINDEENYSGTCYDSTGVTVITCPSGEYDGGYSDAPAEVSAILPGAHEHYSDANTKTYLGNDEDSFVVYDFSTASISRQGKCSTDPSPPQGCDGSVPIETGGQTCDFDGVCESYETLSSCASDCSGGNAEYCADGIDNDGDGLMDAADPDCLGGACTAFIDQSGCENAGQCDWFTLLDGSAYCDSDGHVPSQTSCNNDGVCDSTETSSFCSADCAPAACTSYTDFGSCIGAECEWVYGSGGAGSCKDASTAAGCNYDGVCSDGETTTSCAADCASTSCSSNAAYCTYESECTSYNFYWCNGTCQNSDCSSGTIICSSPSGCTTETDCVANSYYWYDNACWSSSQSGGGTTACNGNGVCDSGESSGSCPGDCGSYDSGSCPSGFHWHDDSGGYCINDAEDYSGTCYDSTGAAVITCPSSYYDGGSGSDSCSAAYNCYDSATCTSSGWYWYSNGCWDYPEGSGDYSGTSCYGTYTDQTSCQSAGCIWYEDHYDGTHCDDMAHGSSGASTDWSLNSFLKLFGF